MGNYHKLASIPVIVADKWMKEGFNIYDGHHSKRNNQEIEGRKSRSLFNR